jgi:two-component system, OmpR family, KDP operon response regulator KdpE
VEHVRLVLVDNDRDALDLLELDLRLEGHDIVGTADTGEAAIRVVERERPDAVVLDYRMPPGIDGLEVARRLRGADPSVHLVLYTNYVRAELVEEASRLGVTFLAKGDLRALRRAVRAPAG